MVTEIMPVLAILFALWKTQGCRVEPWRADVSLGAELQGDELWISVQSSWPWKGKLIFDKPRHRENFNMPFDYARLNQFPEWFTVEKDKNYKLTVIADKDKTTLTVPGADLLDGYLIHRRVRIKVGAE